MAYINFDELFRERGHGSYIYYSVAPWVGRGYLVDAHEKRELLKVKQIGAIFYVALVSISFPISIWNYRYTFVFAAFYLFLLHGYLYFRVRKILKAKKAQVVESISFREHLRNTSLSIANSQQRIVELWRSCAIGIFIGLLTLSYGIRKEAGIYDVIGILILVVSAYVVAKLLYVGRMRS